MEKKIMKPTDVAEQLGLEPQTLARWRTQGRGPKFVKVGSAVRYLPDAVDQWIRENTFANSAEARQELK